ncbi:MAG: energy-coupling factor transporter transmembrane component T [Desulfurococcaceae archaeon]
MSVVEQAVRGVYEGFTYRVEEANALLYKVDPRAKLAYMIAALAAISIANKLLGQALLLCYLVFLILTSYHMRKFIEAVKPIALTAIFLIMLLAIMHVVVVGEPLIYSTIHATFMALRVANVSLLFIAVFSTSSPEDIAQTLVKFGAPFKQAYLFSLTIRFVPTVARDLLNVYDYFKVRGFRVKWGLNILEGVKQLSYMLTSVTKVLLERVISVAEALETGCFGLRERTFYRELKACRRDAVFLALNTTVLAMILLINALLIP